MLLVLASKWDEQAAELDRCSGDVRLLTPDDLSVDGWVFRASFPECGVMVADGECIPTKEITGVFTRLPCVMPHELLRMVSEERDYAAAEMHAFLVAWLSTLRCPVVNRPTPGHLAGPAWGRERWISEAAKQGIPVVEFDRDSAVDAHLCGPDSVITVVGKEIFGTNDPTLGAYATELANIADVSALTVYFEKGNVQFASCSIDLSNVAVKQALFSLFGLRCSES
jgi:hypothetical protein